MRTWHGLDDVQHWIAAVHWSKRANTLAPPSPSEIEERAAAIRDGWSDDERGRRCLWAQNESPSTVELVSLEDLVFPGSNAPGSE